MKGQRVDSRDMEGFRIFLDLKRRLADSEAECRRLQGELEFARRSNVRLSETVIELEEEVVRVGRANDAARREVLRVQALRARLGKRDMSPSGRLRTLESADRVGVELSAEQRAELWELRAAASS